MRRPDPHGAGHFGASRGSRTHNGIDYACWPGSAVLSVECGTVTKLGYPYGDDLGFRYVEVTDDEGCRARYFYVEPAVEQGHEIHTGDILGYSQKLGDRYPGITEHVHVELIHPEYGFIDPSEYAGG